MGRLKGYVHGEHEGVPFVLGPDDELPEWAAAAIPNPDAWDELPDAPVTEPPVPTSDVKGAQDDEDDEGDDEDEDEDETSNDKGDESPEKSEAPAEVPAEAASAPKRRPGRPRKVQPDAQA